MKKFKNIKLMLVGLFCLLGMNAVAIDYARYEVRNGYVYGIESSKNTVTFMGVSQAVTEFDGKIDIPAKVTLPNDLGVDQEFKVVRLAKNWFDAVTGAGTRNTRAIGRSDIKYINVAFRLDANLLDADEDKEGWGYSKIYGILTGTEWTNLEEVVFGNVHNLAEVPVLTVTNFPKLKKVDLRGVVNDDRGIAIPAEFIGSDTENQVFEEIYFPTADDLTIGAKAFKRCKNLKKAVFGTEKEVEIGEEAFFACYGNYDKYEAVDINFKDAKVTKIGNKAFYSCQMAEFTIPATVTSIGTDAFGTSLNGVLAGVNILTKVNFNSTKMTEIPAVFAGQTKIAEVHVNSNSVTSIAANAFADATALKILDLENATALTKINAGAVPASPFTTVKLAGTKLEGESLAKMNIDLSKASGSLTTLTLPEGLTGLDSFEDFEKLAAIDLEKTGVKKIPAHAFDGCVSLTSVKLNPQTTEFGEYAFAYTAISSISVPTTVGTIGRYAFTNCTNLTSLDLENTGVTAIPEGLLKMDSKLYKDGKVVKEAGIDQYQTALTDVKFKSTTSSIGDYAFMNCSKLSTADLALSGLKSIGTYAFFGTALPTVDLSGVHADFNTISVSAFADMPKLTAITLPASIKSINGGAFAYSAIVAKKGQTEPSLTLAPAKTTFEIGSDKLESIEANAFSGTNISALNLEVTSDKFKTIPVNAFAYNNNLATVTLPKQVSEIAEGAFLFAFALSDINLYQTNITTLNNLFTNYNGSSIKDEISLDNLGGLTLVKDENIKIGEDALKPIVTIADYALQLTAIEGIVIPEELKSMGKGAFRGCTKLATFDWRNVVPGITGLPQDLFLGDVALKDVYFLTTSTAASVKDAEVFFLCKKDQLTVYLTNDSYNLSVADGYGNDNREYSTLAIFGNKVFSFSEKGKASDGYYYATYYNMQNSSWFKASEFDVYSAVIEGNKVVLKKATEDGGYYKVAKFDPSDSKTFKTGLAIVRSKNIEAHPDLNSNAGTMNVSTLPNENELIYNGADKTASKLKYQFKLGNKNGQVAFWRVTSGTIKEGVVYVEASAPTGRMDFVIEGEGEVTGIENIFTAEEVEDNVPVFNLQGAQVKTVKKGMYIKNGKKFIVK
jgi:Leucine-rich repeat (LRR) protein